jgi:phosphohistidine phosphatase SixA
MEIILINHAERNRNPDQRRDRQIDRHQPLTPQGEKQAHELAERLRAGRLIPTLYLTSRNVHAKQTAEIVCAGLGGNPSIDIVEIDALTPFHSSESFQQITEQARSSGHDVTLHDVVAVVGHYPRLNQLFAQLTWRTVAEERLSHAQEVRLRADSFNEFHEGKGRGQWPKRETPEH